ncbi:MAG: hypothetical protein KGL35_08870 [Bradyrhizobium sp.]|nr:hypothetical protein [Bradyrhizobium sp.]
MSGRYEHLEAMRRKSLEARSRNPPKRVSRAKALKAYYRDLAGVDTVPPPDWRGCMDEYKANVAAAKGKSLKDLIQGICFECVGAGADPNPKILVRDCAILNCPLRAVRPWQNLKGRKAGDHRDDVQI